MSPFHGQWYWVSLSLKNSGFTLDGGKYQFPSIWMRSSCGASAITVSPTTAFMTCSSTHGARSTPAIGNATRADPIPAARPVAA